VSDRLSRLLSDIQQTTGTVFVSSGEASCRLYFLEQNVAATRRLSVSVGRHRRQTKAVAVATSADVKLQLTQG
jgi:hypothetical protein